MKPNTHSGSLVRASRGILLFFAISLMGWIGETVYAFFLTGHFCDRGLLTLPFCPIYGTSVLGLWLLVGTPVEGGLLLRHCRRGVLRVSLYVLFSALIPTVFELVTGVFFHRLFGLRLWDYSDKPLQLGGYICLPFSILWGLLIPPLMGLLFPGLKRGIAWIPERVATLLAGGLLLSSLTDLLLLCFFG